MGSVASSYRNALRMSRGVAAAGAMSACDGVRYIRGGGGEAEMCARASRYLQRGRSIKGRLAALKNLREYRASCRETVQYIAEGEIPTIIKGAMVMSQKPISQMTEAEKLQREIEVLLEISIVSRRLAGKLVRLKQQDSSYTKRKI